MLNVLYTKFVKLKRSKHFGENIPNRGSCFLEKIVTTELEKLINEKITDRVVIDDSKNDRLIEKIRFNNRTALIKYGYDDGIKHETHVYKMFLRKNEQVPKVLINKNIGTLNILVLEWIDGEHPDLNSPDHIKLVYSTLGRWATSWLTNIKSGDFNEFGETHSNFSILNTLLNENRDILTKLLGVNLIDFLTKECLEQAELVVGNIQRTPLTLDPGDISLHNFILMRKKKLFLLILNHVQ